MQVYQLSEEFVGREPVARLAERVYDRIFFNDALPADFRNHSHLNFAVARLNYPAAEQNAMLEEYVYNHRVVLEESRREQARRAGVQIAEVADAGRRVELRTVGCMAVHRIGALICNPLENALNAVLIARGLIPAGVPAAQATLARWIEEYGTIDRIDRSAAAIAHEEEDITNAKVRYRAVLAKALNPGYAYRADFDRILSKVVSYIGVKDKQERDAWLVNSLGEASQAYEGTSVAGNLSCDKGIWERLLLGLKNQTQREFDNILAVIDLGDLVTNSFNTMQVLRSPGMDGRGVMVQASKLWDLWERARPATAPVAVRIWTEAINQMRAATTAEVMELLRSSRYLGDAEAPLRQNFLEHTNNTADRIIRDWRDGIEGLFAQYQRIRAGRF